MCNVVRLYTALCGSVPLVISQAGLTTTLNSRCSVLAAANSVFGRWDDTKGDAVRLHKSYPLLYFVDPLH